MISFFSFQTATLPIQFHLPGSREIVAGLGGISASRRSLERRFAEGSAAGGQGTVLVVGGAAEALNHHPDRVELNLLGRKGFVRLALRHGVDLVPVFVFGENFVYRQASNPEGSRLKRFQTWFKNKVSFSPPAFYGRGFFQYSFGFLPHRKPLNVVVGSPLRVDKVKEPSEEDVDEMHQRYVQSLEQIYHEHNPTLGDPKIDLVIS